VKHEILVYCSISKMVGMYVLVFTISKEGAFVYPCNENQFAALFIPSLFLQSSSTCFGHIYTPSSGGILYIYKNW